MKISSDEMLRTKKPSFACRDLLQYYASAVKAAAFSDFGHCGFRHLPIKIFLPCIAFDTLSSPHSRLTICIATGKRTFGSSLAGNHQIGMLNAGCPVVLNCTVLVVRRTIRLIVLMGVDNGPSLFATKLVVGKTEHRTPSRHLRRRP